MPTSFVFSPTNEDWATKRKASAHAFNHERLNKMNEVLKNTVEKTFAKWIAEIEASPDKKIVIDISDEFAKLLARNIITICFGEDITNTELEINMRETRIGSDFNLTLKKVTLPIALIETLELTSTESGFKWMNPFYQMARKLTGIKDFTDYQRKLV